jgi:hypothetical protein
MIPEMRKQCVQMFGSRAALGVFLPKIQTDFLRRAPLFTKKKNCMKKFHFHLIAFCSYLPDSRIHDRL